MPAPLEEGMMIRSPLARDPSSSILSTWGYLIDAVLGATHFPRKNRDTVTGPSGHTNRSRNL